MATAQNQKTYMSWYDSFEGKQESKFMTWYHSYQGKKIVNIVYSGGASVVIVGALFKILHWPGASIVLMIGMFTEAFLFLIGILEAPHEEFHWGNVFPQLIEYGSPDERVARSKEELGVGGPMHSAEGGANNGSNTPALSESEMATLKNSIGDLAKTASQLNELGKLATTSSELGKQMEAASQAAGKYAESAMALGEKQGELNNAYTTIAANMQNVVAGTEAYKKSMAEVGSKLADMNSVYALQLSAVQAQAEATKAMSADMAKIQASSAEILKSQQACEEANKKLAAQVADLNKVYGNMLNALA